MRRNMQILLAILAFSLSLAGCDIYEQEDPSTYSTEELFDAFWEGMNTNYVYWSIEDTDWDDAYDAYKANIDALAADYDANRAEIGREIAEMTEDLHDGHMNVSLVSSSSGYTYLVNPRLFQILSGMGISDPYAAYNYTTMENQTGGLSQADQQWKTANYDADDYTTLTESDYYSETSSRIYTYRTNDASSFDDSVSFTVPSTPTSHSSFYGFLGRMNVGTSSDPSYIVYITFNSFLFTECLDDAQVQAFYNTWLEWIADDTTAGIIVDLRSNTGGYVADSCYIWAPLISSGTKAVVGKTRRKTGENRLDYSTWTPYYVQGSGEETFSGKVCVITNTLTASMGEFSTLFLKNALGAYQIGGTTLGGLGVLYESADTSQEVFAAGSFDAGEYVNVYMAGKQFRAQDGTYVDGNGIEPDETVDYDYNAFTTSGTDTRYEAALTWMKTALGVS